MPTYEYRCPEGHEFEQFVLKISAAKSELACPTCGLVAPRRMSAGGGLLFKGSGFYITDYGKDGKKAQPAAAAAPANADGKGASSESATGSSEGKSARSETKGVKDASASGGAKATEKSAKSEKNTAPASTPKSGPAK